MKNRAIIICNGNRPKRQVIKRYLLPSSTIICANGGTKHALALGYTPDIVIGDHDSLPSSIKKKLANEKIKWMTYPRDKDETDSELAIQYAIKQKFKEIVVFGTYGSRIDHFLATLLLIGEQKANMSKLFPTEIKIIEGNQEIYVVTKKLLLKGEVGDYVSLIPLKGDVLGITTKGLLYQLDNDKLLYGKTRGVSNELTKPQAEISIRKGILLAIHTFSDY